MKYKFKKYKFQVGDLVVAPARVALPGEIGLVTARRRSPRADGEPAHYTILIGETPCQVFEYELTKVVNYKFKAGDLVEANGSLGLVTGIAAGEIRTHRDFRYTVLIQGVTCILRGETLTKVNK